VSGFDRGRTRRPIEARTSPGILPDVLAQNLDIVFCGTAAGAVSAAKGAYYAGPGNSFWSTLFEVGLIPRPMQPHEYAVLAAWNMGLTDLAKYVSGSDDQLEKAHFDVDRLRLLISEYGPQIVAFTGKRAAAEFVGRPVDYGLLAETAESTRLFVLPSPSGAARRYWNPDPWRELARLRSPGCCLWTQVGRGE
jgi:double-stranded uracil-DNA glycosylase